MGCKMYPTKSMLDYMTEMNRLFPRSSENDMSLSPITPTTSHRSFNLSSVARSSSSTDTSPDSFPDMTAHNFSSETFQHHESLRGYSDSQPNQYDIRSHQIEYQRQDHQYDTHMSSLEMHDIPFVSPQMYETPLQVRGQRPIVGRKLMAATEKLTKNDDISNIWHADSLQHTPTKGINQTFNQNVYYELFPTENKGIEFKTPIKTSPNSYMSSPKMTNVSRRMTTSPNMINMSPRMTASPSSFMSQRTSEMSPSRTSPGSSTSSYSPRFSTHTFKEPIIGPSTSFRQNVGPSKMCTFCRKNGETPLVYMTHTVKEKLGNKNIVTCPILRSHVCSTCGASGDDAHTMTYCPVLRSSNNGQPLQSTTITLKNTRVKSNGRRRY